MVLLQSDEEDDSDEESVFEAGDVESESEESSDAGSDFDDSDASEDASGSDFDDDDESEGSFSWFRSAFAFIPDWFLLAGDDWDTLEKKAAKCKCFVIYHAFAHN